MNGKKFEELMTAHEAASCLRVHVETVRKMARRGGIPSHKVGSDWRFRKRALLDRTVTAVLGMRSMPSSGSEA